MNKAFALARTRRWLLFEAAVSLIASKVMLRCVAFPRLAASFSAAAKGRQIQGPERERLCRDVRSAVERVAELRPRSMVCFPRAIAVQAMLRRRGVSTTLVYGAQASDQLTAHVWIQDGERGVIGMPPEGEFTVVATYSALTR